jgi:DNA replication protein DnaC
MMKAMTFDNYKTNTRNAQALQKTQSFAGSKHSLYLFGAPGNGKTHLLMAAYRRALEDHCPRRVVFANVSRLLKIERESFETREESEDRLLDTLSRKRIIFLDDFCAENITGRTAEFIYLLLNDAIENGQPRFFFTSNQSTIYINDNISARIASRVNGLCGRENIVKIEGDDWRIK